MSARSWVFFYPTSYRHNPRTNPPPEKYHWHLTERQADQLDVKAHSRISPVFEQCCLRVAACEAFQRGEEDLAVLTGMSVSHSTLQRLCQRVELDWPEAKQKVTELSVDGGKVRLRTPTKEEASEWRDYKSVRLEGIYYAAAFQANDRLQDWINAQAKVNPVVCLGDGHLGIWSFLGPVATPETRLEILDWYHLRENLYKVGESMAQLKQVESELWQGRVDAL